MNETYRIIGSNGDVIEFDDVIYSVSRDTVEGLAGYPVEYDTTAPPGYTGEVVNSTALLPRTITLSAVVWGNGRTELETNRARLISALNPLLGSCVFVWKQNGGAEYLLDAVPDEGSPSFATGTAPDARSWEFTLTLVAHNPTWRAATPTEVDIMSRGGFRLPFTIPFTLGEQQPEFYIDNNGTAPTPVRIELHGGITAPIVFTNETTGEKITVRKNVLEGERLIIDTSDDNLSVTHIDAEGTETNALHYCSIGSVFWQLVPGTNLIKSEISHFGAEYSGTLTYTQRWVAR